MPISNFKIIRIMSRRYFNYASPKLWIGMIISNIVRKRKAKQNA